MRLRYLALAALVVTGALALSLTRGQDTRTQPVVPADYRESSPASTAMTTAVPATPTPARDLSKLTDAQKQTLLTAQSGAMWLYRMNRDTGRFQYGWLPAVWRPMEGDNFLYQAAAAATLARAGRITGDQRFCARAAGAVLALLDETTLDPKDAQVRYTILPSVALNRLAAAGQLLAAIHELPQPQSDLLEKSDQLCNFIRRQMRGDGSLCTSDLGNDGKPLSESPDALNEAPGLALYGLMLSQRQRPAPWKTDMARRAVAYYHPWWKANRSMAFVPAQTTAYTEAYLVTKDEVFAKCVFEMNDWLCGLQYDTPGVQWWYGGFMTWKDEKAVETPPTVACAAYGESLVCAGRLARETADSRGVERYSAGVERNLMFLSALQYTTGNTRHFDPVCRDALSGGFHASPQDGNLRLDYTQQAVAAMLQYVEQ
jgi:hypothetical protein